MKKTVTAVIPTFNRKSYVRNLVEQLSRQQLPEDLNLHIVVVIDGSTDGTLEMLEKEFSYVAIIKGTGNWWFTKSLNEGIKTAVEAGTDYILTMNDDCYIQENLVGQLMEDYLKGPRLSVIGAATLIHSNPARVTFSGAKAFSKLRVKLVPYLDNRIEKEPADLGGIFPTWTLMTRGLLFPVEVGSRIRFFDEKNFPQYGSDDDFVLRVRKAGFPAFISWNAQIFDEPLLTSMGSAITRPTFKAFRKSFFNKYSVNSLVKTYHFQRKHGYLLLLPFNMAYFILGTTYAYLWKYRK